MKVLILNTPNDKRGKERTTARNATPSNAAESYSDMIQRSESVMEVLESKGLPGGRLARDCYDLLVNRVAAAWSDPVSRADDTEIMLVRLRKPAFRNSSAQAPSSRSLASPSAAFIGSTAQGDRERSSRRSPQDVNRPARRSAGAGSGGIGELSTLSASRGSETSASFTPFGGQGNRLGGESNRAPFPREPSAAASPNSTVAASATAAFNMHGGQQFHGQANFGNSGGTFTGSSTSFHGVSPASAAAGVRLGKNGGFFTVDGELVADALPQQFRPPQPWRSDSTSHSLSDRIRNLHRLDPNIDCGQQAFAEAILGARDTKVLGLQYRLVVHVLDAVVKIRFQSDKLNKPCCGSGFMVSPNLLLTNNHVLGSETEAESASVIFYYESDDSALASRLRTAKLDPERFFKTSTKLDYTLVFVDFADAVTAPIAPVVLPLYSDAALRDAFLDRTMFVIQHAGGKVKEVSHFSGHVTVDATIEHLQYNMDTEQGSSGSPVLNAILKVIALHHQYVPKRVGGQIELKDNTLRSPLEIVQQQIPASQIKCVANQGVTITAIVADLVRGAPTFLIEHPDQYMYYYQLLSQDPSIATQIPLVPSSAASSSSPSAAVLSATSTDCAMNDVAPSAPSAPSPTN